MHKPIVGNLRDRRWTAIAIAESSASEPDWWDPDEEGLCVYAAYQPKSADDLASSYLDLTGNGNDCAPGVAPTWDAVNGWKFNGTTQYLITPFACEIDQSQTVLVQFTNVTAGSTKCLFGWGSSASRVFQIIPDWGGTQRVYSNGSNLFAAGAVASGNMAIAGNAGYYNGVQDAGAIGGWLAAVPGSCYIAARSNNVGIPENFLAVYIQAVAIYDCVLTGAQVLRIATEMAAL